MNQATPISPLPLVVDCSVNCEAAAPGLAHRGVKVVMRYYGRDPAQEHYPDKRLTQREANAIHAAGMAIGLSYQRNNGAIGSFSQDEAGWAAGYCLGRDAGLNPGKPEVIKHPKGTVIYFGVDTNDFNDAQFETVATYFTTIKKLFENAGAPFIVGVYGSGESCDRMRKAALVDHFWLAGVSTGWNGTRDFYNQPPANWNLFQNALEVPLEVSVDTNLVNPSAGGLLGAFNGAGLIGSLDDSAVRTNLRFIKANEPALFFKAPDGEPIIHVVEWDDNHGQHHSVSRNFIEARRMVSVLDAGPDWSKVEVTFVRNSVGTVYQGYVRTSMLAPIDRIP
jgi:hypothetical protein